MDRAKIMTRLDDLKAEIHDEEVLMYRFSELADEHFRRKLRLEQEREALQKVVAI